MRRSLMALAVAVLPLPASAVTVTAVCKEPTGYRYRYPAGAPLPKGFEDGFKESVWSFSWNSDQGVWGHVIAQDSKAAGGGVHTEPALVMPSNEHRYVSFVVSYPQSMWVYTIFPDENILMASRHRADVYGDGTDGALFHAKCNVTVR